MGSEMNSMFLKTHHGKVIVLRNRIQSFPFLHKSNALKGEVAQISLKA